MCNIENIWEISSDLEYFRMSGIGTDMSQICSCATEITVTLFITVLAVLICGTVLNMIFVSRYNNSYFK